MREFEFSIQAPNYGLRKKPSHPAFERLVNLEPYPKNLREFIPLQTLWCWDFDAMYNTNPELIVTDRVDITNSGKCISIQRVISYDLGPVVLADVSEGINKYIWQAYIVNNAVWIRRVSSDGKSWESASLILNISGYPVNHIDLTFDQQGRPFIVFEQAGAVKLWWYNTILQDYTVITVVASGGRTPFIYMDERRLQEFPGASDVLLFFWHDSKLHYAIQRERFLNIYSLNTRTSPVGRIQQVVRSNDRRILVYYSFDDISEGCSPVIDVAMTLPYPVHEITELGLKNPNIGISEILTVVHTTIVMPESKLALADPGADITNIDHAQYTIVDGGFEEMSLGSPDMDLTDIEYAEYTNVDGGRDEMALSHPLTSITDIEHASYILYDRGVESMALKDPSITMDVSYE